jgi:hypothetical protein
MYGFMIGLVKKAAKCVSYSTPSPCELFIPVNILPGGLCSKSPITSPATRTITGINGQRTSTEARDAATTVEPSMI